jgi:hypothetical protein
MCLVRGIGDEDKHEDGPGAAQGTYDQEFIFPARQACDFG